MDVHYTDLGKESCRRGETHDTEECLKKLCLQIDASATAMSKCRRKNTLFIFNASPDGPREGSLVFLIAKSRYIENSGQVDLTSEDVS